MLMLMVRTHNLARVCVRLSVCIEAPPIC